MPADFEHGIIDQPIGKAKTVDIELDDDDLSEEDRDLLKAAFGEIETTPDLDLRYNDPKRDLEIIAILSSVNTAVTVMVLGFLYMVGRPRSGAALALNMMYPIDIWARACGFHTLLRLHSSYSLGSYDGTVGRACYVS